MSAVPRRPLDHGSFTTRTLTRSNQLELDAGLEPADRSSGVHDRSVNKEVVAAQRQLNIYGSASRELSIRPDHTSLRRHIDEATMSSPHAALGVTDQELGLTHCTPPRMVSLYQRLLPCWQLLLYNLQPRSAADTLRYVRHESSSCSNGTFSCPSIRQLSRRDSTRVCNKLRREVWRAARLAPTCPITGFL